jgi:hypothetical protein
MVVDDAGEENGPSKIKQTLLPFDELKRQEDA